MKTLKYLIGAAAAVALLATGSSVFAADDVTNSKHNLSATAGGGPVTASSETGICVFCHTPHNASMTAKPLWNRTINTTGYSMYDASWGTVVGAVDSQPGGVSAACLSCHDGTLALDAILNPPGAVTPATFADDNAMAGTEAGEEMLASSNAMLGQDMRNDHPISIAFDAGNAGFETPTAGAKIYNGKVECGSCHNPHDDSNVPFLRIANTASALCLDCHVK